MRRSLAFPIGIVGAFVIAVLLISQLVLPPVASSRIEHRLTENGGSAQVSLHAFPALRLLFRHGDSIEVTGSGLRVELGTGKANVFKNLDGFGAAHIRLRDVSAGPFDTRSFTLDRSHGSSTYELGVQASFSASAVAGYLGGPLGGIAGALLPGGTRQIPVSVQAELQSDGGTPRVLAGGGTVAGVPMGPILEAVTAAIVARI